MLVKDSISLSTVQRKATYKLDILKRTILGSVANENKIEVVFEKEFLGADHKGNVFQIRLKERTHSNKNELYVIEHDLDLLKGNLVLRTNEKGEIIAVLNLKDIAQDWERHKDKFYKIHKSFEYIDDLMEETKTLLNSQQLFLDMLRETEMVMLLFPPLYDSKLSLEQDLQQKIVFNDFFGTEALPLKLTTSVKKMDLLNNKIEILREGKLDDEAFQHYEVRKYFRKLTDKYKLQTEVEVDYVETYGLDKYHWIDHAGQVLHVNIKGLFDYQQVVRITPLNKSL